MKPNPLLSFIGCLAAVLFLSQCRDSSPEELAKSEETPEAETTAANEPVQQEKKTFVLSDGTAIKWTGAGEDGKLSGGFNNYVGRFDVLGGELVSRGRHFITIDMSSVFSDDAEFAQKLKGAEFFDVEKFPIARFRLQNASPTEGDNQFELTGVLDMHGVAKKITFPASLEISDRETILDLKAAFSVNPADFGLENPELVGNEISVDLKISAMPGEPVELVLQDSGETAQPGMMSSRDRMMRGKGKGGFGGGKGGRPDWRNMSEEERAERRRQFMAEIDKNGDGNLGKDELPERMWQFMSRADKDGDEQITEKERADFRAEMEAERQIREMTGEGGPRFGGPGGGRPGGFGGKGGGGGDRE